MQGNNGRGLPPDQHIQQQREQDAQRPATDVDKLVYKLTDLMRSTNITAGPPAHIKPTVWSNPIDLSGSVSLAAAVSAFQTVVTFQCPQGRAARIESYGMNVREAYAYDGTIVWRLRKNGIPVPQGLESITQQRGSIINQRPLEAIILTEVGQGGRGDVFDFQVSRTLAAGGVFTVEMAFNGWTWNPRNNFEGTQLSVTAY